MNRYEVIFIAHSDLTKDEIDGLIDRYKEIVTNFKGLVVKIEKWGVRKLAYRIQKQPKGFYALMDFVGTAAVVNEVERNFKFDDNVLRFQTIKKAEAVDIKEIEKEMAGEKEEPKEELKPETAPVTAEVPAAEVPAAEVPAAEIPCEEVPVSGGEVATSSEVSEKDQEGGKE